MVRVENGMYICNGLQFRKFRFMFISWIQKIVIVEFCELSFFGVDLRLICVELCL